MRFEVSRNTAVQTTDAAAARAFYAGVLGLPCDEEDGVPRVAAGPLNMYLDDSALASGIVLELVVDNVEAARAYLEEHGCKVLKWEGAGRVCFIEDPFGVRFNLWQD